MVFLLLNVFFFFFLKNINFIFKNNYQINILIFHRTLFLPKRYIITNFRSVIKSIPL